MMKISMQFFTIVLMIMVSTLVFHCCFQAQGGELPIDEVTVLKEIAAQVGKKDWDFSVNPCDGNANWATTARTNMPLYNNTLVCDCSNHFGVCHVVAIALKGQDLDGVLPSSLAKLSYITSIELTRNYLSGNIPPEWASTKLMKMVLSANNLSGELPMELNRLTNLTELKLNSNKFTGKILSLGAWTKLQKLHIQGSGLEGPIPASISLLKTLKELSISDLYGNGSQFPNLSGMANMELLILRSCRITGTIPNSISQMSRLRHLDLSFNKLDGDIPDLKGLNVEKMYLTGNSLNGSIPAWIPSGDTAHDIDLSYNKFNEETVPPYCRESLNLFRSYDGGNNIDVGKCLSQFPCLKEYDSVKINCGGPRVTMRNMIFEADQESGGAAKFVPSKDKWGTSSTGNALGSNHSLSNYVATNVSVLAMDDNEVYTTARLSPLSITYYGRCLINGNYTVTLHFAEIVFRDNLSYTSLGRRIFDVYVQIYEIRRRSLWS